jgi:hypothetical protein
VIVAEFTSVSGTTSTMTMASTAAERQAMRRISAANSASLALACSLMRVAMRSTRCSISRIAALGRFSMRSATLAVSKPPASIWLNTGCAAAR